MELITPILLVISIVLFTQGLFALYLMLYAWEHPERLDASRGPREFDPPRESFTVLLPARHEQAVIGETIRGVWRANYPKRRLEIVVVCHADDIETIEEARRTIRKIRSSRIRLETFEDGPINKPRALNVGLLRSTSGVVTVFDAEDDVHPDIFNVVNTILGREDVGIVQGGVQLMNFRDRWFSLHNCLEYFFWFKSRLHFHARVGLIPLGGNTVFIRRELLERVGGWDEQCLTEDADIGIRLSALGQPIRVVYDAQHVTREETPVDVAALVRQRTRWSQGFLQVLRKGDWMAIQGNWRRLLAIYTFSSPVLQVMLTLLWPVALFGGLFFKLSVPVTMVAFLPLYALFFQFLATTVGAVLFTREYGQRVSALQLVRLAVTFLPYQWMLGFSSMRAVYRELEAQIGWEKTLHTGAHRRTEGGAPPATGRPLVAPRRGEAILHLAQRTWSLAATQAATVAHGETTSAAMDGQPSIGLRPVAIQRSVTQPAERPSTIALRQVGAQMVVLRQRGTAALQVMRRNWSVSAARAGATWQSAARHVLRRSTTLRMLRPVAAPLLPWSSLQPVERPSAFRETTIAEPPAISRHATETRASLALSTRLPGDPVKRPSAVQETTIAESPAISRHATEIRASLALSTRLPGDPVVIQKGFFSSCQHYLAWSSGRVVCPRCGRNLVSAAHQSPQLPPEAPVQVEVGERERGLVPVYLVGALCVIGMLVAASFALDIGPFQAPTSESGPVAELIRALVGAMP
jgi:cellulose synthase/poly-beta-1,6-N-acetylglucosamine synthase-like glycosyltransferase